MTNNKFSNKQFKSVLSNIWISATETVVRDVISDLRDEMEDGKEFSRKEQKSILSNLWIKGGTDERSRIEEAQEELEDMSL